MVSVGNGVAVETGAVPVVGATVGVITASVAPATGTIVCDACGAEFEVATGDALGVFRGVATGVALVVGFWPTAGVAGDVQAASGTAGNRNNKPNAVPLTLSLIRLRISSK